MKLTVTNPNNIVQNALIKQNNLSFSLIINTRDKWVDYDNVMSSSLEVRFTYFKGNLQDSVSLIAETDDDQKILRRVRFNLHDTDQLWILFPKDEVYK